MNTDRRAIIHVLLLFSSKINVQHFYSESA